jgi:mannose-1-phosphate guanylyltransferase
MKAFLLAGGHGTRLRPITDTVPKCLVPIRGTPMLSIWLELCFRAGISEVLINLHAHAEAI